MCEENQRDKNTDAFNQFLWFTPCYRIFAINTLLKSQIKMKGKEPSIARRFLFRYFFWF